MEDAAPRAAALERVCSRPGRSCLLYFPFGASPGRLLFHSAAEASLRLHLSHRVLTYMRHVLWSCSLPSLPAVFAREPVTVRLRAARPPPPLRLPLRARRP